MKTKNLKDNTEIKEIRKLSNLFAEQEGRRPRIMIATSKRDSLDSKTKASIYANFGFDVDIPPPFEKAKEIAIQAIESDVHILCILNNNTSKSIDEIYDAFQNVDNSLINILLLVEIAKENRAILIKKDFSKVLLKQLNTNSTAKEILEVLLAN